MSISPNDPKLTAYALGELDDEVQRIEVEKALEQSQELRQVVAEIQEMAGFLRAELQQEPSPVLTEEQRKRIEDSFTEKNTFSLLSSRTVWTAAAGLAAASLLLMISIPNLLQSKRGPDPLILAELRQPAPQGLGEPQDRDGFDSAPSPQSKSDGLARPEESSHRQETLTNEGVDLIAAEKVAGRKSQTADAPESRLASGEIKAPKKVESFGGGKDKESQRAGEAEGKGLGNREGVQSVSRVRNRRPSPESPERFRASAKTAIVADARPLDRVPADFNTEAYDRIADNSFFEVAENPLSTFSIDVDTASYANLRRFLNNNTLPPKDAVRIEEMVNYFSYDYPAPAENGPFAVHTEVAQAPWNLEHRLLHIGLKGKEMALEERPPTNLVFLLDVSGSMRPPNKLPLLKRAMRLLVERLTENDRVAMVVYAGASGLVLPSTSCDQKEKILAALEGLEAGGSTNGGSGIQLAYRTAASNLISGGINRVILATDGDFNVGITNQGDLTRLIEEKAEGGVFLSVLGFGMGNYKDSALEKLADMGNGNYAYIDTIQEARKVLVDQVNSTLVTIAKDVKIQVEFNPVQVRSYRLIGYENRLLRKEDFNDDAKDAGEIGAGHTVTALYEIVPAAQRDRASGVDPLRYQRRIETTEAAQNGELLTLKLRYKEPAGQSSRLLEYPVRDSGRGYGQASRDFRFAAAVASFGMILRDSPHRGNVTLDGVLELAEEGRGTDRHGYRTQFLELVKKAGSLMASVPE